MQQQRPALSIGLVRDILAAQFPGLPLEQIERIGEGGSRAYLAGGEIIFRFAVSDADSAKLQREAALLAELGPALPLAVPVVDYAGHPTRAYPYSFTGYRKIAGHSGEQVRPERRHWPGIAAQAGQLLSALHTFPVERAQAHGVPEASSEAFGAEYRTKDAASLLRRVQDFAPVIRKELPDHVDHQMERYLAGRIALPPRTPLAPVLCHADLKGEHIIVSEGGDAITGVIDWADCCITDPLLDFSGLMIWLGEAFVRQVLGHYTRQADGQFIDRVCFYARCFTLDNLGAWLTTAWDAPLELLLTQMRWAFAEA